MAKRKKQSGVKCARQEARPVELPRTDEQLSVAIVGGGASGIAAAGFASGRAANGAANAKRPSTTARRNVFLKGQTLLAICGARLYNKDIPRGLSQYTRGPPLL